MKTFNSKNIKTTRTVGTTAALAIVSGYNRGTSLARLAIQFGFAVGTVRNVLNINGVAIRSRGRYTAAMTA